LVLHCFNPLLVVVVAGLATGLLVGMDFGMLLETFGEKFVNSRSLATFILILPVIGLLVYYGSSPRPGWRRSLVPLRRVF
jgi:uncharacterized membrane protein